MAVRQELPKRYIDKEKLGRFWQTHPDFRGQPCTLEPKDDWYIIHVPRRMTESEIKSVYYDEEILARLEAGTA